MTDWWAKPLWRVQAIGAMERRLSSAGGIACVGFIGREPRGTLQRERNVGVASLNCGSPRPKEEDVITGTGTRGRGKQYTVFRKFGTEVSFFGVHLKKKEWQCDCDYECDCEWRSENLPMKITRSGLFSPRSQGRRRYGSNSPSAARPRQTRPEKMSQKGRACAPATWGERA